MMYLRKEIILVICLKLVGLFILWKLFFSHPLAEQLQREDLARHYSSNIYVTPHLVRGRDERTDPATSAG